MDQPMCSIDGCDRPYRSRGVCLGHGQPKTPCSVDGCDNPVYGRGWCNKHWRRWRRYGDPLIVKRAPNCGLTNDTCNVEGCELPAKALGWCGMHYWRWQQHGALDKPVRQARFPGTCSVEDCDEPVECKKLCIKHYQRSRMHGDPLMCLISEITVTCSERGCERREAPKGGACWAHRRFYIAQFRAAQAGHRGRRTLVAGQWTREMNGWVNSGSTYVPTGTGFGIVV